MRRSLWILGLALCLGRPTFGQTTTGSIVGVVTDASDAILAGVAVSLRGPAIVGVQTTTTNDKGFYRFTALPPGVYALTFSLAGFATMTDSGVRVAVGTTTDRNASLKISSGVEEVTVVGEGSVIDTQSTQVSTTYDKDWVRNAPLNRFSFFDLINSAPGVSQSTSTSTASTVFGSSVDENAYMLDGTDFTAPYTGEVWPLPNTDAIEEVEVLSLGAPAEYGNLQGAVFNVVTRQGSNSFHGDANFYFQSQGLTARNTTAAEDGGLPYHRDKFNDLTIQLNGPLVKDHLWFFGSYAYQKSSDSQPGTAPEFPVTNIRQSAFFKLNWQISAKNKVMAAFHEDFYQLPFQITANTAPGSVNVNHGRSPAPNLTYTGILSDRTFVEARYAGFYGSDHGDPIGGGARIQNRYRDLNTGQTSGGIFDWYDGDVTKTSVSAKVSHFADHFLGSSHDFKFGVQYSSGGSDYVTGYNNYIYTGGAYVYGYTQKPYHNGGAMRTAGAYADDTVRVGALLTLNLGLRYDHSSARFDPRPILDANGNPTGQMSPGVNNLFTWNSVSPRVGFALKFTPAGKTVLKGHYGRYYRGIITQEFDSVSPSIPPIYLFDGTFDAGGNPQNLTLFSDTSHLLLDRKYRDPFTDQYIASLEQQLAKNLGVSLTYTHKNGKDYGGWTDIAGQYVPVTLLDTAGAEATGRPITVFQLTTDPAQRVFELTNPAGLFSKYDGGVFQITKRMADHWQMVASLVVSRSKGRIGSSTRGLSSDQTGTAGVFNSFFFGRNPNDFINTDGLLIGDRPVAFKTQFLYELPRGFLIGVNYQYQRGRPWARQLRVADTVSIPGTVILAEKIDGSRRVSDWSILDVRLQKKFPLGRGASFVVFADGLNVLNTDESEGVLSQIATEATFGQASNFLLPRRLMLGAKFEF